MKLNCNVLFLVVFIFCLLSSRNKDDDNNNQALPRAIQTGAGTFACTVNGQNFIDTSGGFFNCFYQFMDDEYYFGITTEDIDVEPFSFNLSTSKRGVFEVEVLSLTSYEEGSAFGGVFFSDPFPNGTGSNTAGDNLGELTITKLDFTGNIISGTFDLIFKTQLQGRLCKYEKVASILFYSINY
jgi:hypothetical protein